jgi:hypothetical protein
LFREIIFVFTNFQKMALLVIPAQVVFTILQLLLAGNPVQRLVLIQAHFKRLSALPEWTSWRQVFTLLARLGTRLVVNAFLHDLAEQLGVNVLIKLQLKLWVNGGIQVK